MDLDVFHRAPVMDIGLPPIWPRTAEPPASKQELAQSLTTMTGCTFFGDLLLSMLLSAFQWYRITTTPGFSSGPAIPAATKILKRMLHVCYPNGVRNDCLFRDAKAFASKVSKKSFWTIEEVRDLQASIVHEHDDPSEDSYTLHDALNCVIYIDILKRIDEVVAVPEDDVAVSVFDTWEYDTDHIIACLLSMATVIGVIIKKHFDNIPKLPPLPMELQFKVGKNKWKNYLVCVAWTFLIMGHLVNSKTKNEFVRIVTMGKTLFVERYILESVKKAAPEMLPEFLLLGNILLRLHTAMFKMRDFTAVKAGLSVVPALSPMGPDESCYAMQYKFPLTSVEYDLPITKHAVGIAHSCVLIVRTFTHLWTFLTVDKAWTKASNLHKVVFVDDVPTPAWCFTEEDFKGLKKLEAEKAKRVVELDVQSFFE